MSDRGREDVVRAADVAEQRAQRRGDDELHADGGGEVQRRVGRGHEVVDELGVERRALDQLDVGMPVQMGDRVAPAGGEVVEEDDALAAGEQRVREVGADEAGAAGDQDPAGLAKRSLGMFAQPTRLHAGQPSAPRR